MIEYCSTGSNQGAAEGRDPKSTGGKPKGSLRKRLRTGVLWLARSEFRPVATVFLLAFVLRSVILFLLPIQFFYPDSGWEVGAVAESLATTGSFSDPYSLPTGPTAHPPPLYPAALGLIYRMLGVTATAGMVVWFLTILSYSALYALLPWVSRQIGIGSAPGIIAGLAGAVIPAWPSRVEPLAAIAFGFLLIAFLRRWNDSGPLSIGSSLFLGIGAGLSFHLKPSLLPVVLAWVAFELYWRGRQRGGWVSTAILIIAMVVVCIPWTWRNRVMLDSWIFIRSNFGLELRLANHDGSTIERQTLRHPRATRDEAQKVLQVGEAEYMRQARNEALDWISRNPGQFLWLSAQRVVWFWFGPVKRPWEALRMSALTLLALMGLWQILPVLSIPQKAAIVIPLLTFPNVYYLVTYLPRYREPIEWILLILMGAACWNWLIKDQR